MRNLKLLCTSFLAMLALTSVAAVSARAGEFDEFGFESASASLTTNVAGRHPDLVTAFSLKHKEVGGLQKASARVQELSTALPPGLIGNPNVAEPCSTGQFEASGNCPVDSQVGIVKTLLDGNFEYLVEPLYSLAPPQDDAIARFGFPAGVFPTFIDVHIRTASDYGVTATISNASGLSPILAAEAVIWGAPADPVHDSQRLNAIEAFFGCQAPCLAPFEGYMGEFRHSGISPPLPFLSNPTACQTQQVDFKATTYQLPGREFFESAPLPETVECDKLPFDPDFRLEPSSHRAGAPTGLATVLEIPQTETINVPATAAMRAATVALPAGMTINSAAANGLQACSEEQVRLGREVDSDCPQGSKLGTATFESPALPEPIHGSIYQRTPAGKDLFRLWLVTDELGLHLKLPGEIKADKATGQLTAEFDHTPQLPVERIELQFKGGPTAPLKNPDACGSYSAGYSFVPWSGTPPVTGEARFQVNEGCDDHGFSPDLEAGVTNPVAGSFSPMVMNLEREDGEENISSFDLTLPKGELAKLKGVPLCSDVDAATGGCSAATRIGAVAASTGVGTQPLWIPQPEKAPTAVFLAGPYKGAPYSAVTMVPVQVGPFDLGTVVVRDGLYVDPNTLQVTVKTDPLPQILEGVPIYYRTIHVSIDRSEFTLAPTNCREQLITSTVISSHGAVARPGDRFQVGECAALRFQPSLKLRLKGGTDRGGYPALTARLQTHRKEANIGRISVALPHSEFLAQEHIKTICTRVQFSEEKCPPGSIYGRARAITPLLEQPLEGSVYLRSSSHPLPDLVIALRGPLDVNLVGRIDSVNGGIRTSFPELPDAPVTKFVLRMRGGQKSLLVNSTDICAQRHRALVKMTGQNGKVRNSRPLVRSGCKR